MTVRQEKAGDVVRRSFWRRLLVVAVCALATLAVPALAAADTEPNDGITEAEGPLAGGVTYTGAVANSTDVDTYVFYVNGQQQIDIKVTDLNGGECLSARFGDTNNHQLAEKSYLREGQSQEFKYTTPPGVNRYYLSFGSGCSGEVKYSFSIEPASTIVAGPSTLIPTPTTEPNDNAEQALGPLLGGVAYTGEIQTQNDQDWFKFYTAPGSQQFDVAMTRVSGCELSFELQSPVKGETRSTYPPSGEWSHFTETSATAGIYYLKVAGGCVGSRYEFVVEPPGALTTLAPPPPPPPAPAPVPPPPPAKVHRGYGIASPTARVVNGEAQLELTCAGAGDCAGTMSLVGHEPGDPTAKFAVGSASFALVHGQGAVVPVRLTGHAMGLLHLSERGQLHVHLAGHDVKSESLMLHSTQHRHHRHHHRHRHRRPTRSL
jgi:hypothetical protein